MKIGKDINRTLCLNLHIFNYDKPDLKAEISEEMKEIFPIKSVAIFIERELVKNISRANKT